MQDTPRIAKKNVVKKIQEEKDNNKNSHDYYMWFKKTDEEKFKILLVLCKSFG